MGTVCILLLLLLCSSLILAYTMKGNVGSMQMKGGGSRMPRPKGQKEELQKQQQMTEARRNRPKDVPIFNLFARSVNGGFWIPCGELTGDARAKTMVDAWMSGFLEDMYKSRLDSGVARSVFSQEEALRKNLPFKKFSKEKLQFGYSIEYIGLVEKKGEQKVTALERGSEKGWFENIRDSIQGSISEIFKKE